MKRMMMAAVAMLAAFAAQAVTLSWQTGEITQNADKELFAAGSATSVSLALQIDVSSMEGLDNTGILSFNGNAGNNGQSIMAYGPNSGIGANFGNAWSPNHSASASGLHTVVLTFAKNDAGNFNVQFYIDGASQGFQGKAVTLDFSGGLTANILTNDAWTLENVVAYDGVLSESQIAWMADNKTAVLPEPTALALLALGVAGLALRRRRI